MRSNRNSNGSILLPKIVAIGPISPLAGRWLRRELPSTAVREGYCTKPGRIGAWNRVRYGSIVLKNDFADCSRRLRENGIPEVRQQSNLIPPLPSLPTQDSIRSRLNTGSSDG